MTRGELESRLARDHARLRGKAAVLRSLALGVLRGDSDLGRTLVLKGQDLQASLIAHMDWEDDVLLPNLHRGSDEAVRVATLIAREHRDQRVELLDSIRALGGLADESKQADYVAPIEEPVEVARGLLALAERLERDMATEESILGALPGSDRSLVLAAGGNE